MEPFNYPYWFGRVSACLESLLDAETEHDKRVLAKVARATVAEYQAARKKAGLP